MDRQIQGRVIYVSSNWILLARGAKILESSDCGQTWRVYINLPNAVERTMLRSKSLAPLRKSYHLSSEEYAFIIANKKCIICKQEHDRCSPVWIISLRVYIKLPLLW